MDAGRQLVALEGGRLTLGADPANHLARVGNRPSGIAFGAGRVWVANTEDGTVSWIDPQSNKVGTTHLGFHPTAVAADQGAVWVALAA
jgi:DNA-binding beta-propeller fold protein YncE